MKKEVFKLDVMFELSRAKEYCDRIREIFEMTGRDLKILDKALTLIEDEISNEICIMHGRM